MTAPRVNRPLAVKRLTNIARGVAAGQSYSQTAERLAKVLPLLDGHPDLQRRVNDALGRKWLGLNEREALVLLVRDAVQASLDVEPQILAIGSVAPHDPPPMARLDVKPHDLRPDDVIVAVDGIPLNVERVVESMADFGRVRLRSPKPSAVEWWLYPDMVAEHVTVERVGS